MDLVVVNGWAQQGSIWQGFFDELARLERIQVIDLTAQASLLQLKARIHDALGEESVLVGWSFGGAVALEVASENPKVAAVITLMSNPCFLQRKGNEQGMSRELYNDFASLIESDELSSLVKRFSYLMATGSVDVRTELRQLRQYFDVASLAPLNVLQSTLSIYAQLDSRSCVNKLNMPCLQVFGEEDALVPVAVTTALSPLGDRHQVRLPEVGHLPFFSAKSQVISCIKEFCERYV